MPLPGRRDRTAENFSSVLLSHVLSSLFVDHRQKFAKIYFWPLLLTSPGFAMHENVIIDMWHRSRSKRFDIWSEIISIPVFEKHVSYIRYAMDRYRQSKVHGRMYFGG